MAELADAPDLGSGVYDVQVQVLSSAPEKMTSFDLSFFQLYLPMASDIAMQLYSANAE